MLCRGDLALSAGLWASHFLLGQGTLALAGKVCVQELSLSRCILPDDVAAGPWSQVVAPVQSHVLPSLLPCVELQDKSQSLCFEAPQLNWHERYWVHWQLPRLQSQQKADLQGYKTEKIKTGRDHCISLTWNSFLELCKGSFAWNCYTQLLPFYSHWNEEILCKNSMAKRDKEVQGKRLEWIILEHSTPYE